MPAIMATAISGSAGPPPSSTVSAAARFTCSTVRVTCFPIRFSSFCIRWNAAELTSKLTAVVTCSTVRFTCFSTRSNIAEFTGGGKLTARIPVFSLLRSNLTELTRGCKLTTVTRCTSAMEFTGDDMTSKRITTVELSGGRRMVAELVGAFNELAERMGELLVTTSSSRLLFQSLKVSIPLLHSLPPGPDGRAPLARALSVASLLADIQMDAEVISAGMLKEALEARAITMQEIKNQLGTGIAHLLHESLRIKHIPSKTEIFDDEDAHALRKYCLTYYDIRAVILELALKLDKMRHLNCLTRYQQQIMSLEVMKIYAPLAHAVGAGALSVELEDLSFRYLFPNSYVYVDTWLRSHELDGEILIEKYKEDLLQALQADHELEELVEHILIQGRFKSRFSTMKKLLKDGRKPEEVNDLLGLRVILSPRDKGNEIESGHRACYRVQEIVRALWKEVPSRTKDYISRPKPNGYKSLHVAVHVSEASKEGGTIPLLEIQIRTKEMDLLASGGSASHSLYKGGLTDAEEGKRLKAIMLAAAELVALRLRDLPSTNHVGSLEYDQRNHVFHLLDKNGDGRISIEELTEVMEDLGAGGKDAQELMQLLDANSDGSLSSEEFELFQKQVEVMRSFKDKDNHYRNLLDEKLELTDSTGLIQVYRKELGDKLAVN